MKVQYSNRNRLGPELEAGAEYVDFDRLVRTSDIISLYLPLNVSSPRPLGFSCPNRGACQRRLLRESIDSRPHQEDTRHVISTEEFDRMKTGVVIVNTARGAVMTKPALVEALDGGKVFSCGLDVYENEPDVHSGLVDNPKVMLVPHMGTWTLEVRVPPGERAMSRHPQLDRV